MTLPRIVVASQHKFNSASLVITDTMVGSQHVIHLFREYYQGLWVPVIGGWDNWVKFEFDKKHFHTSSHTMWEPE